MTINVEWNQGWSISSNFFSFLPTAWEIISPSFYSAHSLTRSFDERERECEMTRRRYYRALFHFIHFLCIREAFRCNFEGYWLYDMCTNQSDNHSRYSSQSQQCSLVSPFSSSSSLSQWRVVVEGQEEEEETRRMRRKTKRRTKGSPHRSHSLQESQLFSLFLIERQQKVNKKHINNFSKRSLSDDVISVIVSSKPFSPLTHKQDMDNVEKEVSNFCIYYLFRLVTIFTTFLHEKYCRMSIINESSTNSFRFTRSPPPLASASTLSTPSTERPRMLRGSKQWFIDFLFAFLLSVNFRFFSYLKFHLFGW